MDSQINDRIEDALSDHQVLEQFAEQLQAALREAESHLPAGVLRLLHGEALGHPLHPILVHLPLGGWLIAGLLDFLPLQRSADTEHAADLALLLGTIGATGAIAAGWTDWANTRGQARRTGLIHGGLNETAFLLNTASLLARRRGKRGLGKALSGTALGLALVSGFLGGQLVYRHGLGVHHTLARPQG
ncbi:hypothetical protein DEIPH_ctg041orf0026 [Deinococcus phoenicis]|uniref:DUF2231 domain-containing protein n=1 Tax=Deinococcus phoenicis TaxID=1476583 RepID=A0A016QNG9_9DEIO|nr:DUF2231 domain-containing protein [Deinococcus phoenicis]EYB67427.1 hypothetical protein DEIPH_ctg041orf0026 [Deinococcus phoenicis]